MSTRIINVLSEFDIEFKPAIAVFLIIICCYIGISSLEFLNEHEDCKNFGYKYLLIGYCGDYGIRLNLLNEFEWNIDYFLDNIRHFVSLIFVKLSYDLTGDYRTFSLVSSVILLSLVFLITRKITGVNYISLVAVCLVIISPIFYKYDVVLTYPNFWVTALLASIYLGLRNSPTSILFFILSIPLKAISLLFAPALILFFKYSNVDKRTKYAIIFLCIALMIIAVLGFFFSDIINHTIQFSFQPVEFLYWLGMWTTEFQNDRISLIIVMFSIMGLYLIRQVPYVKSVLFLILLTLIQPAIIAGFTTFTNEEYRMLPLLIFSCIGIGLIVVNFDKMIYELQRFNAMFQK